MDSSGSELLTQIIDALETIHTGSALDRTLQDKDPIYFKHSLPFRQWLQAHHQIMITHEELVEIAPLLQTTYALLHSLP